MNPSGNEEAKARWLDKSKEEAATTAQAILSAVVRALYIFVIEALIHGLLHGLEKFITHETYPKPVYRIIEWAGIGSLLSYVGTQLWKHFVLTYVETRLETRDALNKLGTSQSPRNKAQVENVTKLGHNDQNHEA